MRATCNHHSLSANPFVYISFASLINLLLPHSVPLHSIHWRRRGLCESRVPGLVHAVRHLCAVCHVAAATQVVRCGRHNHRQLSPGRNYHQEIAGQSGKSTIIVQFNFGLCLTWPFGFCSLWMPTACSSKS